MSNLLGSVGVLLVIAGISALIIGTVRHFFPFVDEYFPESFKKPLSFMYGAYYFLAGLMCLLVI